LAENTPQRSNLLTILAFSLLILVSFGMLIPWLGFYWDDWPVIYLAHLGKPAEFLEFYRYDRPFSVWTYLLSAPVLGTSPLPWHLFTLTLRWLAVVGLWWSLRGLWPERGRLVTWVALLFAVYPAFTQQPMAVAYSQHWISYALYFLSIGTMIHAWRSPHRFWPLTLMALSAAALHLFTMEYFLGLELLRPVFLWMLVSECRQDWRTRLTPVAKRWLPYALVLLVFFVWRLFVLDLAGEDPNRPILLANLLNQPVATMVRFLNMATQDSLHTLIAAWYATLQPGEIEFRRDFLFLSYLMAAIVAIISAIALLKVDFSSDDREAQLASWPRQAFILGLLAMLLGSLPAWLLDRQVITGLYSNRFTLPAMFGASVLIAAFIEWLSARRASGVILLSLLVGLASGFHLRNGNEYRWIWEYQTQFYWQLYWRAPGLKTNTALLSEDELFPMVGA
jgi:hypothetical protein